MNFRGVWISLIGLLAGWNLPAQTCVVPGQPMNRTQVIWKAVSSENFDVFYPQNAPAMGVLAAKMAEECRYHFARTFDYTPQHRYSLYLYTDPYSLTESNQFKDILPRDPGTNRLFNYNGTVIHPGDAQGFYNAIRKEVGRLVLGDYYYGGNLPNSIQSSVLLYSPEWFSEGLSTYFGEGWTYKDAMLMESLKNENLLNLALEGNGVSSALARKSIWHFIVSNYGIDKLSEIFYMTRLTRSAESGVITVLGITLKTLTERWREWILQQVTNEGQNRNERPRAEWLKGISPKEKISGYAMSGSGEKAAVFLSSASKQRIVIYDIPKKMLRETPLVNKQVYRKENLIEEMPLAMDPEGKRLAGVFYKKASPYLFLMDVSTGRISWSPVNPSLDKVVSISFSSQGERIVISALRNGQTDLYTLQAGNWKLNPLTEDGFDDQHPVFSEDDRYIYFASNRDTLNEEIENAAWLCRLNSLNLFRIASEGGKAERVSWNKKVNEIPLGFLSADDLLCLSDQTGVPNLVHRNVMTGALRPATDYKGGLGWAAISDIRTMLVFPEKGTSHIAFIETGIIPETMETQNTRYRDYINTKYNLNQSIPAPPVSKAFELTQPVKDTLPQSEQIENPDTAKPKTNGVKFYVFDEEDTQDARPKKKQNKTRKEDEDDKPRQAALPEFGNLSLKPFAAGRKLWTTESVTTRITFSPAWVGKKYGIKPAFELGASFCDLSGNNRVSFSFQPYLFDLRSGDFRGEYSWLKNRLDLSLNLTKSSRFLKNEDFLVRYSSWTLGGSAFYPLSRWSSVSASPYLSWIKRYDLDNLVPQGIEGSDLYPGIRLNYHYSKLENDPWFTRKGTYADLLVENNYSLKNTKLGMLSVRADIRRYTKLMRNFVLATRVMAGGSFGPDAQQFYLGGLDNVMLTSVQNGRELPLNDPSLSAFRFMSYVTPLRGFRLNSRNGTKYVTATAELRIPVSRLVGQNLNSSPLYTFEVIPFFDIGTIWRTGNPLSQKNPIDTEPIVSYPLVINVQTLRSPFLIGFGSGIRTYLMGYSIRADFAWGIEDYSLQKPRIHLSLGKNF